MNPCRLARRAASIGSALVASLLVLWLLGSAGAPALAHPVESTLATAGELGLASGVSYLGAVGLTLLATAWRRLAESVLARGLELLGSLPTIIFCAALVRCFALSTTVIVVLVVGAFGALRVARLAIRRVFPIPTPLLHSVLPKLKRSVRIVTLTQIHELSRTALQLVGLEAALCWLMPEMFGKSRGWGFVVGSLAHEGLRGAVLLWAGAALALIWGVEWLASLASARLIRASIDLTMRPQAPSLDPETPATGTNTPLPKPADPSK